MKTDDSIKRDVEAEIRWDPDIEGTDITVAAKNGVVTLAGFVRSYSDKYEAERAAKRVSGVSGIANDIEVRLPSIDERPDSEIARDAVSAIRSRHPLTSEHIKVVVNDRWVTLEGNVEWQFQRQSAERAVRRVKGVRGISNQIVVKPKTSPQELKHQIEEAFKRSAEIDANHITVETNGGEVILKGTVRSWVERQEAERAAWAAPGVIKVVDQITVSAV